MAAKELKFGNEARIAMARGVDIITEAVKATLGPKGRNVVLDRDFGAPHITKDGVTVAKEIVLPDHYENMGAQMIKQVASKTAEVAGDGTTTATILAQAIIHEGMKAVTAGMNPMDLRRGIEYAVGVAVDELIAMSTPCDDTAAIKQVGTISANSDESIGEIIADAMEQVTTDGVITVEDGSGLENELDVVEGMQFDRGYLSPYFVTDQGSMTVEMKDPSILLLNKTVNNIRELLPVLEAVAKKGSPLLLIVEGLEGEALATLVMNHVRGVIKACAIQSPGFGDRRKAMLEDLAVLTGGTVVSEHTGLTIEKMKSTDLGTAKRVVITQNTTTIVDGGGTSEAIAERVAIIKEQFDNATNSYEEKSLHERSAKLSGGVAIIKVGAATEIEMKEKRDRVDDALSATRAAVEEGVVPGGGVALARAAVIVGELEGENHDQTVGIEIVSKAMEAPLRQIVINAGESPDVILATVMADDRTTYGYNAADGTFGDMLDMGIIDPTKVTRYALQNAASIAGLMITTEVMITSIPVDNEPGAGGPPPGMMPGMM